MSRVLQDQVHIRWMVRSDMESVQEIENHSFSDPWKEEDFIRCLRHRNVIAIVAEYGQRVVGFAVYEIKKHRLEVLNLAVHEDWRYKGVGAALITKLKSKLSDAGRGMIQIVILEINIDAQLFLKAMRFKCVRTHHGFYQSTDADAYEFRYFNRRPGEAAAVGGRPEKEGRCDDERGA